MGSGGSGQGFMALPGRPAGGEQTFPECLAEVVRVLGLDVAPEEDAAADGGPPWGHRVRGALREACERGLVLSEEAFGVLVRAAVLDPNPSFNRQFVEPALNAFGYGRVRAALLDRLRTGSDREKAGAARAWYWTALEQDLPGVTSVHGQLAAEDGAVLVREWDEAALREFVANEDLDVRRCLLPGLRLRASAHPAELHGLVETAVAIARAHPDEYLRQRVEHQVGA
ncbi:hypothetical protein ACPC54_05305 [Kitasatospora sp. NPDC094028]